MYLLDKGDHMKKLIYLVGFIVATFFFVGTAQADGCYQCQEGGYVKYSGSDNATNRKAAAACGCTINGTRSSCNAANLKILCTVQADTKKDNIKLASSSATVKKTETD